MCFLLMIGSLSDWLSIPPGRFQAISLFGGGISPCTWVRFLLYQIWQFIFFIWKEHITRHSLNNSWPETLSSSSAGTEELKNVCRFVKNLNTSAKLCTKKNGKTNTEVRVFTSLVHSQEQPLPALQSSVAPLLIQPVLYHMPWMPRGEQHCIHYLRKSERAAQA